MGLSDLISHVKRATVLGVDPGTTAAWAVLDLEGNVLATGSSRDAGTDVLLERALVHGTPVVVAADVTPSPESVEKLSRAVDAQLWVPGRDLSIDEKRELARDHPVGNDHERDALAAALKAYAAHRNLFERIEIRTPGDLEVEEVKRQVLRGRPIAEAIRELETTEEEPEEPERKVEEETLLTRQARTIARLRKRVEELKDRLDEKSREIEVLRSRAESGSPGHGEVEELRGEVSRLHSLLNRERERSSRLSRRINEARRGRLVESRGGRIAYRMENLTRGEARRVTEDFDVSSHPVYVESGGGAGRSGVEVLAGAGVEAVISEDALPHHAEEALLENQVPLMDAGNLELRHRDAFTIMDEEEYSGALEVAVDHLKELREGEMRTLLDRVADELS